MSDPDEQVCYHSVEKEIKNLLVLGLGRVIGLDRKAVVKKVNEINTELHINSNEWIQNNSHLIEVEHATRCA